MATFHVSHAGSNTAPYDTWAKAASTIAAALAAITAGGGHTVRVAPGIYYEYSLVPNYAGVRGANNLLIGDFDGALGSGLTGYVVIDASIQTGNFGRRQAAAVWGSSSASNAMAFWDLSNVLLTGSCTALYVVAANRGTATDNVYTNCLIDGGIYHGEYAVDPDNYSPIKYKNCFIRRTGYCTDDLTKQDYVAPMSLTAMKQNTFTANPQFVFENCYIEGTGSSFSLYSDNANFMHYSKFSNCALVMMDWIGTAYNSSVGIFNFLGCANDYSAKVDATDCILVGYRADVPYHFSQLTLTRCQTFFDTAAAASTLASFPLLPGMRTLFPGSTINAANGANGVSPDMFGNARGSNNTVGPMEIVSGRYLKEPNLRMLAGGSSPTTKFSGGAF